MKVIKLIQKAPEWLSWRSNGIGASDIPSITGTSPYLTKRQLFEIKKGLKKYPELNEGLMTVAANAEEDFRQKLLDILKIEFMPLCGESETHPRFRASFDGINLDHKKIIEIKFSSSDYVNELKEKKSAAIKKFHQEQIQWQLFVSGFESCYYGVVSKDGNSVLLDVKRDNDCIAYLVSEGLSFLEMLDNNQTPELAEKEEMLLSTSDSGPNGEAANALKRIAEITKEQDRLEAEAKELKEKVKSLGHSSLKLEMDGEFITAKKIFKEGSISYQKALFELVPSVKKEELDRFKSKPTEYWAFLLKGDK